jgi:cyclopropane-fatty-acyl-phospholipid synthase
MVSKTSAQRLTNDRYKSRRRRSVTSELLFQLLPLTAIEMGSLTVTVGEVQRDFRGAMAGEHAELVIHQPLRFLWLLFTQGEFGFAEAWADGVISSPNLYSLLRLGAENEAVLGKMLRGRSSVVARLIAQHRANHNSIENSRSNISAHYDLGNPFYQLWLDETMSYSSALNLSASTPLAEAQTAKYRRIMQQIDLQPHHHILEIGCGWGGFAHLAAATGARVTGITLSTEQLAYARQRITNAGLAANCDLRLQDYRHLTGTFDHIVSIEMFEAVGKEYWHEYFRQLQRLLKPGGRAVLQIITIDAAHAERYQSGVDFIQRYIFPGGLLPSQPQLQQLAAEHGFTLGQQQAFAADYAETLRRWRQRFDAQGSALRQLGYDDRFQRLWRYYLDYCRVGFELARTDVVQITLEHAHG